MSTHSNPQARSLWTIWRMTGWGAAALLLCTPWLAMQFTDEVDWNAADFVVFGAMLAGAGFAFEVAVRRSADIAFRAAVAVALTAGVLLIWVNGAVGIVGAAGNDFNLLFGLVLVVGIVGAVLARLDPRGMVATMLAMAFTQAFLAVTALVAEPGQSHGDSPLPIIALNGFFVALFCAAAWLFRVASRTRSA